MINPSDALLMHCKKAKITILKMPRTKTADEGVFRCSCQSTYNATAFYVLKHMFCKECHEELGYDKLSKTLTGKPSLCKKTHAAHVSELKLRNPTIRCVGKYVGSTTKIKHECTICGDIAYRYPANAIRFGCSVCTGVRKKTIEEYNAELKRKTIPFSAKEYLGSRTNVEHTCTICKIFTVHAPPTNALRKDKLCCPVCFDTKTYSLDVEGRIFRLRGYERFVLPKLLKVYKSEEIFEDLSGKVPKIQVGTHIHRPDFYIPKRNLLIEVKSIGTLGIGREFIWAKNAFKATKAKKKAAEKAGYTYMLALMTSKGTRIPVPNNWETYTKAALVKHISSLGFKC